MGTDETMRTVSDVAKRLAKLEQGGEEANKRVSVHLTVHRNGSAEHFDSAYLNLGKLKSLTDWSGNLLGDRTDYEAESTRGVLELMSGFFDDIIEDMEAIELVKPDFLTHCKDTKDLIEIGALTPLGAFEKNKELIAEIDRFLTDVVEINNIRKELEELAIAISKRLPAQPKTRRASAEP